MIAWPSHLHQPQNATLANIARRPLPASAAAALRPGVDGFRHVKDRTSRTTGPSRRCCVQRGAAQAVLRQHGGDGAEDLHARTGHSVVQRLAGWNSAFVAERGYRWR